MSSSNSQSQAQIGFEQLGIGAVLKRYRLLVPPNQRDYAWTEREVSTLVQDLALAISEDEPQHFLGTIVTIPRGHGVLEVVDGQQRLATIALLLAAMRHVANGAAGNLARALESYLIDVDTQTLEVSPKMRLNTADTLVFHELLTEGKSGSAIVGRESHQLLTEAFNNVKKRINQIAQPVRDTERTRVFVRWMNYIEHNSRVILLIVPNSVNAFKMFETLNDRGLKVSQADLVKNYIFGQAGDRLAEAQQIWSYVKGSLETLDEEDITINFLRQALITMRGYLRETEIYETVQREAKGSQSSLVFLSDLERLAGDYVALFNSDHEKWNSYPEKTRRLLRVLQLFDIKPFRPLLLSIAHRFVPKEAAAACERLVAFGVRLIVAASTRSGSVEQPLARAAKQVYDEEITTSAALIKLLLPVIPNDTLFAEAFSNLSVSQAKFARYYLRSLEQAAAGDEQPWLIPNDDPEAINLEHVLPQRPMDKWPGFDDETIRAYSRRLGNMALLQVKPNSDLRSAAFKVKRPVLASSPYETTRTIAAENDWTAHSIVERQRRLADLAITAWPIR